MIYTAKAPVTDPAIAGACARFASEITPVLPMDRMAIVLLEHEGDTSRVVYSWANPSITGRYCPVRQVCVQPHPKERLRPCGFPLAAKKDYWARCW